MNQEGTNPITRALRIFLIVIGLFLLYAYAVDVTSINLEEPQDEQRQATTVRVIRALARPDFFAFNEETRGKNVAVRIPCGDQITDFEFAGERSVTLAPGCADTTQDKITVNGSGFRPNTDGIIRWYPPNSEGLTRALTSFSVDRNGDFSADFTMPDIRPSDDLQRIEIEEKWRAGGFLGTGIVGLSEATRNAIEKIIETILLALVATTLGTLLAIPFSFIAARNLMENVRSPLAAIMMAIVLFPIAWFLGAAATQWLGEAANRLSANVLVGIVALAIMVVLVWGLLFSSIFSSFSRGIGAFVRGLLALGGILLGVFLLANLGVNAGNWWNSRYETASVMVPLAQLQLDAGLVGRFTALTSEFIQLSAPWIAGLLSALAAASFGSRMGQEMALRWERMPARIFTIIATMLGVGVFVYGVGSALHWLYQFTEPERWTLYPAIIVGIVAGILTMFVDPKQPMPIGFLIYSIIRGILNIVRSIEPLVYVIVFAVWVGIGAFAGVLALSIHTIAALGKLFSEQVESIDEGPIEAITATGANGIQTVVFGVIPQIIPPFIAFTFYRWDINVRVSTILGFGGGGGIGFLLIQHINLLQYRQASVMMIAIALVVMTLDYFSSKIRSQII